MYDTEDNFLSWKFQILTKEWKNISINEIKNYSDGMLNFVVGGDLKICD